jgi:hypothetical protein
MAVWDASILDALFQALWAATVDPTEFPVLHEQSAGGGQPFPFCVFDVPAGLTTDRMSKGVNDVWEIRDVDLNFRIHTTDVEGDARTAKEIGAYLAEEVMKVFGGHPTQPPTDLVLINGNHLITTYQNDFSLREGEDNYQWTISYTVKLDVPVMVTNV